MISWEFAKIKAGLEHVKWNFFNHPRALSRPASYMDYYRYPSYKVNFKDLPFSTGDHVELNTYVLD